jgi:lysophospholipase L1-like esterase
MKTTIEKILILVGILNIIAITTFLTMPNTQANQEQKTENTIDETVEIAKNENFVFLGDSITDWCPFEGLYEDSVPIVNSGKAGYRTFELLPELEELVYQYNPTKVFLLIGTNDLNTNTGEDELVDNIEKIIKRIKKHRPNCKIYVQSIYPVNRSDDEKIDMDTVSKRENKVIQKVNKNIKQICNKHNVTYIDVYSHLIDEDGNLKTAYTTDGLHLSNLGYLKVTKVLDPYVEE